jgi:hypothetical protein
MSFAEGKSTGALIFIDIEIGEILSAEDMTEEEMQDRERFLEAPSEKMLLIGKKSVTKWVEDTLQVVNQNYDMDFINKVGFKLAEATKQNDYAASVTTALICLEGEGLNHHYFASWLEFLEGEEKANIRNWLSLNGIDLVG